MKKKIIISILTVFLLIIAYALYACLPFAGTKGVSEDFKRNFNVKNFYSDSESGERVMMLDSGADAYFHRLSAIEQAEEQILFSSFSTHAGETTNHFFSALIKAADRGVKVKILLDAKFAWINGDNGVEDVLINHDNVELYFFNKFNFFKPYLLNISMHDKFLCVDDKILIFGGRNVGDKYYDYEGYGGRYSYDREVLVYNADGKVDSGRATEQVKSYFKTLTDNKLCYKKEKISEKRAKNAEITEQNLLASYSRYFAEHIENKLPDYTAITYPVNRITLITNPVNGKKKEPWVAYQLLQLALDNDKALIQSPYTVLTKKHLKILKDLCGKTDVTLLTNSMGSTPNLPAFSNYYLKRDNVLKTGINIYEYQGAGASIHAKSVLIGDRFTAVGSFNLDERSIHLDTESMLVIDSKPFAEAAYDCLENYLDKSLKVNADGSYQAKEGVPELPVSTGKKVKYSLVGFFLQPFVYLL